MKDKQFLLLIIALVTILSGCVVGFNYFIDPYDIFGTPRIKGVNSIKADINNYTRLSKAFSSTRGDYDWVIVGNSRVEMGLSPEHACFGGKPVFNLGLPGAGIKQQLAYALNLLYLGKAKNFIVSVDFVDFLTTTEPNTNAVNASLGDTTYENLEYKWDGTKNELLTWQHTKSYYQALYSLSSLKSSFATLLGQKAGSPDRTIYGFNPANDFRNSVEIEGVSPLFVQKLSALSERYSKQHYLARGSDTSPGPFQALESFINIVQTNGGKLIIHTNPFHDDFWRLINEKGLAPARNEWHDQISTLISKYPTISFYDFSNETAYSHEAGRGNMSKKPLQWFWEPSHYTKKLGDLMIGSLFTESCSIPQ